MRKNRYILITSYSKLSQWPQGKHRDESGDPNKEETTSSLETNVMEGKALASLHFCLTKHSNCMTVKDLIANRVENMEENFTIFLVNFGRIKPATTERGNRHVHTFCELSYFFFCLG